MESLSDFPLPSFFCMQSPVFSQRERNHQMSADLTENLLLYICAEQNEQALSPSCTVLGVLNQLERSSGRVVLQ